MPLRRPPCIAPLQRTAAMEVNTSVRGPSPLTATRPKRQNSILASPEIEPEPPQPLGFDDVVDVDSDTKPQIGEAEMGEAEVLITEDGRSRGVDRAQVAQNGFGFSYPHTSSSTFTTFAVFYYYIKKPTPPQKPIQTKTKTRSRI